MLYERWRQLALQRKNEWALSDLSSGRRWTFSELLRASENGPPPSGLVCPQGHSAKFILDVLLGWRGETVVCPLEPHEKGPKIPLPPKPCCHLKSTSATTGPPRYVAFGPDQLAADARNIVATMGLRPDWPNLGVISLAHSYGFSNLVLPLLLEGIPLVLLSSPFPEAVSRATADFPDLTLPGVPALWRAWHEAGLRLPNVRRAISAGAPLPATLEQAVYRRIGLKIHNFYGSTECGGISYDRDPEPRTDEACVGTALNNVRLEMTEAGCLEVHSQAVGLTYWPEPFESLRQGRFITSDHVEFKNGKVYLSGRASDQINVAGRKVAPSTIEAALRAHEDVRDCLIFGVPSQDADRADQIVACVVSAREIPPETLKQFLLQTLPSWQIPRQWWFVDSLQANHRGKHSRSEWRRRFLERGIP